jgi:hypothetical protein
MKNLLLNKLYHTEKEVSYALNISVHTLQKNRIQGKGLKYHKFGRSIRYATEDILEYLDRNSFNNTSEYSGHHD